MPALVFGFVLLAVWLYSNAAKAAAQSCADQASPNVKSGSYGFNINNPGNIRWIENAQHRWRGMIANVNGYAQFDTLADGVRAIGQQLTVDYNRGADTITKLITSWAPAGDDNNTAAYIADVSQRTNIPADSEFAFNDAMPDIVAAIIVHENGYNSIDQSDLLSYLNS